jgi:phosphoenolpyruvate carboxykinase (ATP)
MAKSFLDFVKSLPEQGNVRTFSIDELDSEADKYGRVTSTGGRSFNSNVRNRSAGVAVMFGSERVATKSFNPAQQRISESREHTLEEVRKYLLRAPLIRVQRTIGDNSEFNPKCNLFLSVQRADNVRQACLWSHTLRDYDPSSPGPDLYEICIPEWPENERQVLVFPEENLTVILGIDYVGEVKMGFLRMAMWDAKQEGLLSLHAGSKVVTAQQPDGDSKRYGMLFFGLSGTGKTTHACHGHGMGAPGEVMDILQDDIVALGRDGRALGTERGFYLKTEGMNPETQALIYGALRSPEALFENVMLTHDGEIDYTDLSLGGNGRAVIPRTSFGEYVGSDINLPSLDQLDGMVVAFITRRMTVLPLVSRLNPEQAAAAFMLGESVETSAGDPRRAGESVRVVGTNPFLIGSEADEGNWFYDFIKNNEDKVQCFLLNTGGVGEILERDEQGRATVKQPVSRVPIPEMSAIIRGILRNTVQWGEDPLFGTEVPVSVDGLDIDKYDLSNFYTGEQVQDYATRLKEERRAHLASFPGLNPKILEACN